MNKLPLRMTALVACLFSGLAAHAVPLTYDFAGTGSVCTFASDASCASTYEGAFSGSVTIDVLANGPSGPDSFTTAARSHTTTTVGCNRIFSSSGTATVSIPDPSTRRSPAITTFTLSTATLVPSNSSIEKPTGGSTARPIFTQAQDSPARVPIPPG